MVVGVVIVFVSRVWLGSRRAVAFFGAVVLHVFVKIQLFIEKSFENSCMFYFIVMA